MQASLAAQQWKLIGHCEFDIVRSVTLAGSVMTLSLNHRTIDVEGLPLHVPEGINYSCSGCGRCCSGVAVPMTEEDFKRISGIDFSHDLPAYNWKSQFRKLSKKERANTNYVRAIKPTADGVCPFLVNKLCHIHGTYGEHFKPLICGLFPYSFNHTPSGIYLTVSFRSNAVLFNSGSALTDQLDVIQEKLRVYKQLYVGNSIIWDTIKLATDIPLSWSSYLEIEHEMLTVFLQEKTIPRRLLATSDLLFTRLKKAPVTGSSVPNRIDKGFLAGLFALYFPSEFNERSTDVYFNAFTFIETIFFKKPRFRLGSKAYSFETLAHFPWSNDPAIDELLTRFVYSRVFGKWYFGGGFAQLSVVAGFHHLAMLVALAKLQAAARAIERGAEEISLLDLMYSIRQLEEKASVARLDGYSAALWELILFSRNRVRRILEICFIR